MLPLITGELAGVAVLVTVDVGVLVAVVVGVPVAVGVPPQTSVMMLISHPPAKLPKSPDASSTTYSDHVPFGDVPRNVVSAEPPAGNGAGAGNVSTVSMLVGMYVEPSTSGEGISVRQPNSSRLPKNKVRVRQRQWYAPDRIARCSVPPFGSR